MLHLHYSLTKAEQAMKTSLLERLTELERSRQNPTPLGIIKTVAVSVANKWERPSSQLHCGYNQAGVSNGPED